MTSSPSHGTDQQTIFGKKKKKHNIGDNRSREKPSSPNPFMTVENSLYKLDRIQEPLPEKKNVPFRTQSLEVEKHQPKSCQDSAPR